MKDLYTEQDYSLLKKQISRRVALVLAALAAGLACIALTLVMDNHRENRPELLTTLAVIFSGSLVVFLYDMLVHPLNAYARHMDTALHGRTHEISVVFDHFNEETSFVDGVYFRDLIFLGEADKHGDRDRMFYWDRELPLPDFSKGQEITLKYYDRFIVAYQA